MLFRYNTSLFAFDRSGIVPDTTEFKFLPFIQNIELQFNMQKISQKSLGKDVLDKKFYTNPDFSLNISSIQENNFLLERLIGFFINGSPQTKNTILNSFDSKYISKAFMLFNDNIGDDILFKIRNAGYSEDLISFVFNKLFLNTYSFSYRVGALPITNLSFSFDDIKISNVFLSSGIYYAQDPSGQNIKLENSWIDSFYFKTNSKIKEKINSTSINFELVTDYSSLEVPSSDFSVLSSSNIQSMDFSLDFQRNKFFFFEKGMSPFDRSYLMPCIGRFTIQGITSQFNKKTLASLKNSDSKFSITLKYGKSGSNVNYSEIKFENVTVDNFSYSMSLDGFLNYSIECSIEINETSGAKFTLLEVSDQDENFIKLHSSDGHKLVAYEENLTIITDGTYQSLKIGNDIDGESAGDQSGYSIATNNLGDRIVIGAIGNDGGGSTSGHARIYSWNGSSWVKLGNDIDGEAVLDYSGWSVAMNGAGDRVVIGAVYNDAGGPVTDQRGHARVYSWNGSVWSQMGSDIDGEAIGDQFGYSVSMNDSGDIIAIGAPFNDPPSKVNGGSVRVYSWNGSTWMQVGADIDGEATNDQFGNAVSLNEAGNIVAIGAFANDGSGGGQINFGSVRVYSWNGSTWNKIGQDIDGEAPNDQSGFSVSLNASGDTVAIGARFNDAAGTDAGHVRVWYWNGTIWTKLGQDIDGEFAGDNSGWSVAINDAGDRIVVGAINNDGNGSNSGNIRIFAYNGSSWIQLAQDINGEATLDQFGFSVAINAEGNIIAAGANFNDGSGSAAGHTRAYQIFPTQIIQSNTGDLVVLA